MVAGESVRTKTMQGLKQDEVWNKYCSVEVPMDILTATKLLSDDMEENQTGS
jgi:hypothetical protein